MKSFRWLLTVARLPRDVNRLEKHGWPSQRVTATTTLLRRLAALSSMLAVNWWIPEARLNALPMDSNMWRKDHGTVIEIVCPGIECISKRMYEEKG